MMALLLCNCAHSIHEGESGFEIVEFKSAYDVVLVNDAPMAGFGQLTMNLAEFAATQRGNATTARNTASVGKGGHSYS